MPRMTWSETDPAPALVVRFDRDRLPPWDREVEALVEELEERLGDVFVTPAAGPGGPTLRDALAAARFAGCESAVVVTPVTARPDPLAASGALPAVTVRSAWNAAAIASAYERSCGPAHEIAAGG